MAFELLPSEVETISLLPELDLADLAVDLDLIPDAEIDRPSLLLEILPRLLELAAREGLPFSRWDQEDLEGLPEHHRAALAEIIGGPSDPASMLKAGAKVYKTYRKLRTRSQIPLMLPLLLPVLARYAASPRDPPSADDVGKVDSPGPEQ